MNTIAAEDTPGGLSDAASAAAAFGADFFFFEGLALVAAVKREFLEAAAILNAAIFAGTFSLVIGLATTSLTRDGGVDDKGRRSQR